MLNNLKGVTRTHLEAIGNQILLVLWMAEVNVLHRNLHFRLALIGFSEPMLIRYFKLIFSIYIILNGLTTVNENKCIQIPIPSQVTVKRWYLVVKKLGYFPRYMNLYNETFWKTQDIDELWKRKVICYEEKLHSVTDPSK